MFIAGLIRNGVCRASRQPRSIAPANTQQRYHEKTERLSSGLNKTAEASLYVQLRVSLT